MNDPGLLLAMVGAWCAFTMAWPYTRGRTITARHYAAAAAIVGILFAALTALFLDVPGAYLRALTSGGMALAGAWGGLALGRHAAAPAFDEACATPGSMWWVVPFGLLLGIACASPMLLLSETRAAYLLALGPVLVTARILMVRRHRRVLEQRRREPVLRIHD